MALFDKDELDIPYQPLPAPQQYGEPIGPIPAPDHWSSGRAGTPAFDPRTNARPESLGDMLMSIGKVASRPLSQLIGVDVHSAFADIEQQKRYQAEKAFRQQQYNDQRGDRAAELKHREKQAEQQRLQMGLEMAQQAEKISSPELRNLYRKRGHQIAGLNLDPETEKALLKADADEREMIYSGILNLAKENGLSGAEIAEIGRRNPELALKMIVEGRKAKESQSERQTGEAINRILGGSGAAAPQETPSAEPRPQAMPQSTPQQSAPRGNREAQVHQLIDRIAQEEGADPRILKAIAKNETSGYDSRAVSPAKAKGLMQFIDATAARFGVKNPFDDEQAIRGAAKYTNFLSKTFHGDPSAILAAYNAGEGAVQKWRAQGRKDIPYAETRGYVEKGMKLIGSGEGQVPTGSLPEGASTPATDRLARDTQRVEQKIEVLQTQRQAIAALPRNKASEKALDNLDKEITFETNRLDRLTKRSDKAMEQKGAPKNELEAKITARLPEGGSWDQLTRPQQQAILDAITQQEQRGKVEVQESQGRLAAEIRAGELSMERRKSLQRDAEHNGLKLPVGSDKEVLEFAKKHNLQGRDALETAESKALRVRQETHDTFRAILDGAGAVEQGVIAGPVQKLMDRFRVNPKGLETRAAYRALIGKAAAEIKHELLGAAQSKPELKSVAEFLPSVSDNLEVAVGKIRAVMALLQRQQGKDVQFFDEQGKAVPPSTRLSNDMEQFLEFREEHEQVQPITVDTSRLRQPAANPPAAVEGFGKKWGFK